MGGATRLMAVLTISSPPMRPSLFRLRHCISALSSFPVLPLTFGSPTRTKPHPPQLSNALHSQPGNYSYGINSSASERQQPPPQERGDHPWTEWTNFVRILSSRAGLATPENGGFLPEDAFVAYEALPDDFVRAASLCLAFARGRPNLLGSLSRKDIQAIVSNGTPFLFKSALDTARRMRAFLDSDGTNVSEVSQADTVDLMKYILSYASNPAASYERNGLYSRELVDTSIRNVLHELGTITCGTPTGYVPASHNQRFGQNIEMKRGDWICPKCKFMNFARNIKCLECEEPRPKRQLVGAEWECPQCDFFNYGKNPVCLRCDCRRPGASVHNSLNSRLGLEYNREYSYGASTGNRSVVNEEGANRWFSNNSQLNHGIDSSSAASEDRRNMQARVQETTISEISDKKTISSESHGIGEKNKFSRNSANEMSAKENNVEPDEKPEPKRWYKRMMELQGDANDVPSMVLDDEFPTMPKSKGGNEFMVTNRKDRSLTSPKYKRQVAMDQAKNTNFVPFVPFPPGYFATKDTEKPSGVESPVINAGDASSIKSTAETGRFNDSSYGVDDPSTVQSKDMSSANSQFSDGITSPPPEGNADTVQYSTKENASQAQPPGSDNVQVSWTGKSLEGSAVRESDPLDMSEEAKAERWFRRVAQIKDISELSQIPDEDFPSIMPMRKGVNRFVVSKRKTPLERRLTSQQYRRNLPIVRTDPVKKEDDNS